MLRATSGPRTVQPGQTLHFNFTLLVTPLKPLVTDNHWAEGYYHAFHPPDQVARQGANVLNIHHGTAVNPLHQLSFSPHDKEVKCLYSTQCLWPEGQGVLLACARLIATMPPSFGPCGAWADEVLVPGPNGGAGPLPLPTPRSRPPRPRLVHARFP